MRKITGILFLAIGLLASGCIYSLHPFYQDKDVIFDESLLGEWEAENGDQTTISRQGKDAYLLVSEPHDGGKKYSFSVHLFKLGKGTFMDMTTNSEDTPVPLAVPAHSLTKIDIGQDQITVQGLNYDYLEKLSKKKKIPVAYTMIKGQFADSSYAVATGSTKEIQKYLLKNESNKDFFDKPSVLKRKTKTGEGGSGMAPTGFYQFTMKTIDGKEKPLAEYKGKVLLVVNVASMCGNTPQYKSLESMYEKYKDKGLVVLGFPANEFGKQEPGKDEEIKKFCDTNYHVTFDMFSKIVVKGEGINPLYKYLTTETPFKGDIGWNFAKFLVDRDGNVVARYEPKLDPLTPQVVDKVEELLKK